MKLLIIPLLCAAIGAGAYGLRSGADDPSGCCPPSECRVTVECTGEQSCLVTCLDEDGDVLCQQEVQCDEACGTACATACEKPCDEPSSGSKP